MEVWANGRAGWSISGLITSVPLGILMTLKPSTALLKQLCGFKRIRNLQKSVFMVNYAQNKNIYPSIFYTL